MLSHLLIRRRLTITGSICSGLGILLLAFSFLLVLGNLASLAVFDFEGARFVFPVMGALFLFIGLTCFMFAYLKALVHAPSNLASSPSKETLDYGFDSTNKASTRPRSDIAQTLFKNKVNLVFCQECETNNDQGARFCDWCGKPLIQVCAGCRSHNDPDAHFCRKCGDKIN